MESWCNKVTMSSEVVLEVAARVLCLLRARDENEDIADASCIVFFWLITTPLSLLTQTQYSLCATSISFILIHSPSFCSLPIFTPSSIPHCCGSRSFISLSGARCPGTASVRHVVINGSMKSPAYSPLAAHPLRVPLPIPKSVWLCICQKLNSPSCCYQSRR